MYSKRCLIFGIILLFAIVSLSIIYAQEVGGGGTEAPVANESNSSGGGVSNTSNTSLLYVSPEVYKSFENSTWVEVIVKYKGDINITPENEEEMFLYYMQNRTETIRFFDYIPETEMKLTSTGLLALKPSFTVIITKEGLDKLKDNPRVYYMGIVRQLQTLTNESNLENKIESKGNITKTKILLLLGLIIAMISLITIYIILKKRQIDE